MRFVQIIEYRTSKPDEVRALNEEWAATAGDTPAMRVMECTDRNDPTRCFTIVEFPSYEEAMANSESDHTKAMAEKMQAVCDGPPTFYDLDLQEVRDLG